MVKRKPGMEGIDVMASHLTQNRMLQTSAHESSLSGLSMFRTVGASHKPLSLENTILSGNSLNQKTFYSQISTVEAPTKKQNAYQAEQKKPVADSTADTVLSENQKMARLASFSMESWSELASLNENEEYNEEMFVTSAVPTDWYDTNPPSLVDEKLLGQVDEARGTKANLLQFIASSLVDGGVLKRFDGRSALVDYLQVLSRRDPEFILKCAVYCRRELNIRTTANAILAIACLDKACYPFLDKYFSFIISLPSDWIEVAEYFKAMTTPDSDKISLSKPMRRNMIEKFTEFDYHQLAKHSKEKGRLKRAKQFCRSTASSSEPSDDSHPFIHMKRTCLTLKYLIRVLHIHAPTFPVMCLLGKRYPSSATEFVRLGLEGTWDPSLVGKRMKLPSPVTWETELSKNGNNAMTWSDLIKENKVPYMAMLRNLRNIIKSGLEPEYHDIVIKKLTNRNAVISSKLFPSRFFTAYVVLQELDRKLQFCSYLCRLRDRHFREKRKRGVVVGGKKGMKRKEAKYLDSIDNKDVVHPRFSEDTLEKYQDALNKAIGIAVRNNLPPIRGNTLIVCCFTVEGEKRKLTKQLKSTGMGNDIRAMGIVLASMCAQICECSTTYAILDDTDRCYAVSDYKQPEGAEYNILSQASTLLSQFKTFRSFSLADCLMEFNAIGYHFDTVYVIGDMCPTVAKFVAFQRAHVGSVNAVWSNLSGTDSWSADCGDKSGWLTMKGPTDQVLRYLSEASDKSLLDHVERIDELYGLVKPVRVQFPDKSITDNATAAVGIEVDRPVRMQWRYCRIFISSTFRDMHAERDLICGLLVPALRQYAAQTLRVHLLDVDLRWGVPESSTRSSQALEMCLDQAVKADLFVLLLGNRYGWSPDRALVNTLPGRLYQMLTKFYVLGMSITEMEYNMAKLAIQSGVPAKEKRLGPDAEREALRNRVFAFVRDPASLNGIPKEHALEFEETQDAKRTRLKAFKTTLQRDGVLVLNNYPSWFNGLIANRPVMGNLSVFGNELSRTLREAMNRLYKIEDPDAWRNQPINLPHKFPPMGEFVRLFIEPVASSIAPRQLLSVERAASEMIERGKQCHALRSLAAKSSQKPKQQALEQQSSKLKPTGHDGTILLITGSTGSGKTTHLTALTMSLFSPLWTPTKGRSSTDFDESDPRGRLISRVSTSTNITTSIDMSVRPKLAPHQLFVHFTDGLVVTGLPPKTQLLSLLNRWTDLLVEEIQLAARVSAHVTKKLDDVCGEAASNLVGGKGALLKSKMLCLSKLIGLLEMFPTRYYAFILDAADRLQPPLLDWLPTVLPSNVRVVLTCDARSSMARYLSSKPDCLAYTVTSLSLAERSAAVRSLLGRYGKVLNESGFRNQLSILVNKREADIPFYLKLACEELRLYGTYEELDYQLKKLPDTVPVLVRHIVARAEAHSGSELVLMTLGLLACSRRPLSSVDLCTLLDAWLEDRRGTKPSRTVEPSWKDLISLPSTADNLCSESSLEQAIEKLILEEQDISITSVKTPKRAHIPSLAFHILLSGIRPLLAGLGDEDEPAASNSEHALTIASSNQWGLIRLRNTELVQLIQDICFNANKKSLSTFSRLGYHKPTGPFLLGSSNSAKRFRPTTQCPDPGEPSRQFTGTLDRKYIHWLLATRLPGLDNKVYHFFHAGQLEVVVRLLGSPTFLIERLRSGQGSLLLEDFQGYPTSDIEIQEAWVKRTQTGDSAGMLAAMRQFIANNSMILTKYPFLFYELAANYNTDPWIRRLGLMHIKSRKEALKSDVIPNPIRFLVRRPQSMTGSELGVNAAHMPHTVCHPSDVASVVALSPDGHLLIYGTQTGTVTLVSTTTMREIRSFYGHVGAVLSLCFLVNHQTSKQDSYWTSGTEFSLVSTARDRTICLWLIPSLGGGSAKAGMSMDTEIGRRLASWTGPQNSDITCSAWHSDRGLLATGSLDCTVVLWNPPRGTNELITRVTTSDAQPVALDYKARFACHSPVSCLAFRLPSSTASEPQNDLAVGCWDGNVRIFDVEQQQLKICVNISTSSICSVDYSVPDDGALFVVQDLKGVLLLLRSDHYVPLTTVKNNMYQNREKLTDTLLESWVPRHGQAYFARPSGRYLIQSGAEDGHLIVWNAQLGADCGQWFTSKSWNVVEKQIRRVTACAADPCGRFLVVGSDCRLDVVCSKTGRTLTKSSGLECRFGKDYPVSCVACALVSKRPIDKTDVVEYLGAAGTSGGNLVIFCFSLNQSSKKSNYPLELEDYYQLWGTLLTDRPGGLLSLDTTASITAVGSAHGEAYVITSSRNSPFDVTTLTDMGGSPITCVKIGGKLIAFGSKNGCVHVYRVTDEPQVEHVTTIFAAANDWITAIAWSGARGRSVVWESLYLVVGSNDQRVRIFSTSGPSAFRLCEVMSGPGGPITTLSVQAPYVAAGTSEGFVRLWSVSRSMNAELLTTMDVSADKTAVDGTCQPAGLICAHLFYNLTPESSKPGSRERTKSADQSGDADSDSSNIFARMDVTGLLEKEPSDDDDGAMSSTASLIEIDDTVESADGVGTVAVADTDTDAPNKNTFHLISLQQHASIGHHTFVREGVRSRGQKAAILRLIVGQEILVSDGDNKGQAQFRTRTYAPLVLEQRAHLQGHLGLIANSLSSTVSTRSITDCECILASVAQQSNLIDQNNVVGCDIRLWQVPVYGTPKQEMTIKHTGAVTSFTRILERNRTVWLVSGGTDGSLIFWRSDHSAAVRNAAQSLVTGGAPWIPAFRLICSNVKITSLVAFPPPSEFPDHICVCIAIGRRVLLICLHKQILRGLESQRSVGLDQLLRMFDQLSAQVIYASLELSDAPMGLFLCQETQQSVLHFHVIHTDGQYSRLKAVLQNANSAFFVTPESLPPAWDIPFSSLGCSAFTLDYLSAKAVNKMLPNLKTQAARSGLSLSETVHLIERLDLTSDDHLESAKFLVVIEQEHNSVIELVDIHGHSDARIECIPRPVTIVAICSLVTPTKKQSDPSYCAVATSDGFVRLYERNATQQDVLVQVGLYPTGERITKMQLLEESPMQLVVGTQSGSVLVYEIV